MRLLIALTVLLPSLALAQASTPIPAFELEQLELDPSAVGSLAVGSGELLPLSEFRASLALHYERSPLVLTQPATGTQVGSVVSDRITAHLGGAYAVHERIEVAAAIPIVSYQGGQDLGTFAVSKPAAVGLGTPVLGARFGLLRSKDGFPLDVSLGAGVGLPVGSAAVLGRNDGFSLRPRVAAGMKLGPVLLSADVGTLLRKEVALLGSALGSQFEVGGSIVALDTFLRPELNLRAAVPASRVPSNLELLAGLRHRVGVFEAFALGGPGFGSTPGTPLFRVLLGVAFHPVKEPKKEPEPLPKLALPGPCDAGQTHSPAQCPDLDDDGDGIKNSADACPLEPEDKDGFQDTDGCPDPDNDGDGIVDEKDQCPLVPGLPEYQGCPAPDRDHDGVLDADDKCPDEAGPANRQGCPLHDRDADGIIDEMDRCPDESGPLETGGCPPKDTDGDSVPDHLDNCPKEPGPASNQGCPEQKKQLVVIRSGKIDIKDKVFFATGKAQILPKSFPLLDQVAAVILGHPELEHIVVEGHTDNRGAPALNRKLSQDRADAVKTYFLKKGIAAARMSAKGYGPDKPAGTNDTEQGRENNRRVEFSTTTVESGEVPEAVPLVR